MHGIDQRMTQPLEMKTNAYVGGVEKVNGNDAWSLFKACAAGDASRAKGLLAKDRRLVNAWCGYQLPIHMAVREGHSDIVKVLLEQGTQPSNCWQELLVAARERGRTHGRVPRPLRLAEKA